jgi:hypothetical protein
LGVVVLQGSIIKGEFVEPEPQANMLSAGLDLGLGHNWELKRPVKFLPSRSF